MGRIRSKFATILSAAALVSSFALTTPGNANTLRWGNLTDPLSMDPQAYFTILNASFLGNIYEGLVRFDRKLTIVPGLATSWERVDPVTWRFKLRPNVKFHNGNAFTADDVVASLLRAADKNSPTRPAAFWIKDVKKIDDLTVDIICDAPHATVLNDLTGVYIMNKQWMVEHDALRTVNPSKGEKSFADLNANGTGPFMLVSRRPDTETDLKANPNWWDKPEHNITDVIFRPISSDATRVSALLSGEYDLINPAPLQDLSRLDQSGTVKAITGNNTRMYLLQFNQGIPKLNDSNVTDKNPLADVRVRKALHESLNFDLLATKIMRGMTKPTGMFVAPAVQGYDKSLDTPAVQFDPTAAKKLLADAGYPNGFEVGFDCSTSGYVNSEQLCQAIAAMWSQIGVKAHLTMVPFAAYNAKIENKQSDIYIIGWANSPQLDAFSFLNNIMYSKGTWNPAGYHNPDVDALVEKVRDEQDMKRRQELMSEAFKVYKADFGSIPLFTEPMAWGAAKNFSISQGADSLVRLYWGHFD